MRKALLLGSLMAVAFMVLTLHSCVKDRVFTTNNGGQVVQKGTLLVNELVASGSTLSNELGITSDWFEIYNPSSDTVHLTKFRWHFSDSPVTPAKWALPTDTFVAPHSFLMVFCDDSSRVRTQIHTNFGLSSSGESVVMSYTQDDGSVTVVDSVTFTAAEVPSGKSYGRQTDGSPIWVNFDNPTPNASNGISVVAIDSAVVVINELVGAGSTQVDPVTGVGEDWFELYNTTATDITMAQGQWIFIGGSTAMNDTLRAEVTIPAHGFLVVWCDLTSQVAGGAVHTNFHLPSGGSQITLRYINTLGVTHTIDTHTYAAQTGGHSFGRMPDGSANWTEFTTPTQGQSNH